ncbi:GntR family transcriptional regulator [Alkalihalobacillus deserti]|uniref:GntR family transcriptional regulator n=1 Tax=Alkalihalobacillus deserti TaxID=2879466 RepID=UPI001D1491B5|nr:GntR family transcriptional regulator [Alkalihalobacillus deserti]
MELIQVNNRNKNSIRGRVYELLRERIINLELTPGMAISENEVSDMLQVSRTPVREAFLRLSQEGLVNVYPQKGSIISLIDWEQLEEARFMREVLELATISIACKDFPVTYLMELTSNLEEQERCIAEKRYEDFFKFDDQFHSIIYLGCKKARIWNLLQNMMSINFSRVRILSISEQLNIDKLLSQHIEIVNSIKNQDPIRGEQVTREHLNLIKVDREELFRKFPNYFLQV